MISPWVGSVGVAACAGFGWAFFVVGAVVWAILRSWMDGLVFGLQFSAETVEMNGGAT